MPSMTAQFDKAFNQDALSDDRIDRLATLMGSITRMSRYGGYCTMTDNGETLLVSGHYCPFCRDNGDDGEGDCIHKRALRLSWQAEVEAMEADREDYDAQRWAASVGMA